MAKNKEKVMWPDLKLEWERVLECFQMLKSGTGRITQKTIEGKQVYYTERCEGRKKLSIMDKKKSITIGEYKVQQPSEKHVSIVWTQGNQLVFFAVTDHWYTDEELKTVFEEHMKMFGTR